MTDQIKMTDPFPLSNSQSQVFRQCPEKWWLQYQENLSTPSSPALEFGIDIHKLLASCMEMYFEPAFDYENFIADQWGVFREYGKHTYTLNMVLEMVQSSLSLLQTIGVEEIVEVEKSISTNWFRGIIDLIFIAQGKIWVWDWKTTSRDYTEDSLRNQTQLTAYSYLHKEEYGQYPDYIGIGAIHKSKFECTGFQTTRTLEQVEEWLEQQKSTYSRIWEGKVRYKDDQRCNDYFQQCPFFENCWGKQEVKVIYPGVSNQF